MDMERNEIFDVIITFIKGCKNAGEYDPVECKYNDHRQWIWNSRYLLNQIVRNYQIDSYNRRCVSKHAQELWDEMGLGKEDIYNYHYQERITLFFTVILS